MPDQHELAGLSFMQRGETPRSGTRRSLKTGRPIREVPTPQHHETSAIMNETVFNSRIAARLQDGKELTRHELEEWGVHNKLLSSNNRDAIEERLYRSQRHLIPLVARLHLLQILPTAYFQTAKQRLNDLLRGGPDEFRQNFWGQSEYNFVAACGFATGVDECKTLSALLEDFGAILQDIEPARKRAFFQAKYDRMQSALLKAQARIQA